MKIIGRKSLAVALIFVVVFLLAANTGLSRASRDYPGPALLAQYPEIAQLGASDAQEFDEFGGEVAISGDTIAVSAHREAGGTGDPLPNSGAVYIFERDQGGPDNWGEVLKLTPDDPEEDSFFGGEIALDGDTLVVAATGGSLNSFFSSVYVFERDLGGPGNWGQSAKLTGSDEESGDRFGWAVAIHGDTLVVGAEREDGGVGNPLNDAGAAYVFERDLGGPDNWGEAGKLGASDAEEDDEFGRSVSIFGDTIAVGAWDASSGAGAAYIFERDLGGAENWGEADILSASDGGSNDHFGIAITLHGDTLVVGANTEDGGPGNPLSNSGAAYVFERSVRGSGGGWSEATKLSASDAEEADFFGSSASLAGDVLVIGAYNKNDATGAAYVFERNAGGAEAWGEVDQLTAGDGHAFSFFGVVSGASLETLVIGAPLHFFNALDSAGSAYVYQAEPATPTPTASPSATATSTMDVTSTATATSTPTPTGTPSSDIFIFLPVVQRNP